MAALDPSADPVFSEAADHGATPRATLKVIRTPIGSDSDADSELDSDEEDQLAALLNGQLSDDDDDESDSDEVNGGPSDPSRSKKVVVEKVTKSSGANGADVLQSITKLEKGKALATDDDSDDSDDDSEDLETEEFVLCTLDTTQHYQQPLDITFGEDERVYFRVTGTHAIHLTGNYVIPVDDAPRGDYDEDEDDYEIASDEDDSEDIDDLDDLLDPQIMELEEDEEEVPALVKKGKNKRAKSESDDEEMGLDDLMSKSKAAAETNGDAHLTKKQKKKLKNNEGKAAPAASKTEAETSSKKVSFAKNLEQGPTPAKPKPATDKPAGESAGGVLGKKVYKGVTVEERKLGKGPAAKKGSKVAMRYIGKLKDGKQFDANKKGKPFSFNLGKGEVIQGWEFGLEGIKAGGERRMIIPANLAYGKKALPGIPANSELTFDVKCLSVD